MLVKHSGANDARQLREIVRSRFRIDNTMCRHRTKGAYHMVGVVHGLASAFLDQRGCFQPVGGAGSKDDERIMMLTERTRNEDALMLRFGRTSVPLASMPAPNMNHCKTTVAQLPSDMACGPYLAGVHQGFMPSPDSCQWRRQVSHRLERSTSPTYDYTEPTGNT